MDNSNQYQNLSASIEAILFYLAEPVSINKLSSITKSSISDTRQALALLEKRLDESEGGIRLLTQGNEVTLGTAPNFSEIIEQITRDELNKELSKAALETLSIICYKGPLTRSEVDYVRGVNSTFIIRNLLIRGIVEKLENPRDSRAALYGATFAALEYMGVTKKEDLPQYAEIQIALESFLAEREPMMEEGEKPKVIEDEIETPTEDIDIEADTIEKDEQAEGYTDPIEAESIISDESLIENTEDKTD